MQLNHHPRSKELVALEHTICKASSKESASAPARTDLSIQPDQIIQSLEAIEKLLNRDPFGYLRNDFGLRPIRAK